MAQGPGEVEDGATAAASSTDDIRSQIEQTRAEMADTIDAIQTRLSPSRVIADAKDSVTDATMGRLKQIADRTRGSGESVLQTVRANPLSIALLATAAVGLVAGAVHASNRRRSTSPLKREALIAYLRDHLSGSDVAVRVVHRLRSTHQGTEDGTLFRRLSQELEEDRSVVRTLLTQLGASGRSIKRAAGFASGTVLSVTAGGEPGDLSLLRTLEALAIGVQGKRCLWRSLQNLHMLSAVHSRNFVELEAKAVRQWEAIEERRRALVARTFSVTDPRTHAETGR
jgi:Protein of unknown function (DUF3618)